MLHSKGGLESVENRDLFKAGIVMPLWSLMVWIVLMNTSMFNIALPDIISDLEITPATGSWIATGYSVVLAISTITYSRLSDFKPVRLLIMAGMMLFGAASIIGFYSQNFGLLLFARLMQAAGAGASQALGMVLVARYIPVYRRGRFMSWLAAGASLAFGLGPVVGGMLAQLLGWNYLFLLTSLVLLLFPVIIKYLPLEQTREGKFDLLGGVFLAAGTTGLLLSLTTLSYKFLVITIIAYGLCWKHIHKVDIPFIHPKLLRNRNYLLILFMGFSNFATHFYTLFSMPILLSAIFKMKTAEIGLVIFPGAMIAALAAIIIGRLIDRFGTWPIMISSHVLLFSSTVILSFLSVKSPGFNTLAYLFMGLGFFPLNSSLANELTRILPKGLVASGLGMLQLTQFFGVSVGVAAAGILITLQQSNTPQSAYQNIFLVISTLVIVSGGMLLLYLFSKKRNKALASEDINN